MVTMGNDALTKAKAAKNDEFYTQLTDIENEMHHYKEHFEGKTIYMNCDDPQESNFWKYFALKFDAYHIKKLISTHFNESESTYKMVLDRDASGNMQDYGRDQFNVPTGKVTPLEENGDFRSEESIALLEESDIVVTNPPFSLFREFVAQMMAYEKDFIIIGSKNAVSYKEIFPLLKDKKVWLGYNAGNGTMYFDVPDGELKSIASYWYTTLDFPKRHEDQTLYRTYEGNEEMYPPYDNYDGIEVSKVKDIPMDYEGLMGVPITFVNNHNPEQFEILGMAKGSDVFGAKRIKKYEHPIRHDVNGHSKKDSNLNAAPAVLYDEKPTSAKYYTADNADGYLKSLYARIIIRNKNPQTPDWK